MSEQMTARIRERLQEALAPTTLEVVDEGHLHVGHAGEGQGHYRVRISCSAFAGVLAVKRHRMVYQALEGLLGHGIHALAIEAHAPGEAGGQG